MTIQDHSDVTDSNTLLAKGNGISMDTGEQGEDQVPKIRKQYTITKQRERWTEEEHNKFLEALKLYGRNWRKIEEHVGTKTAVQIRSHAQKFFSKVVRESSSIKPIEIPPPRPKKKPTRPYPRKFVPPFEKEKPLEENQSARSASPNSSVDQENQSPTSVLSTVASVISDDSQFNASISTKLDQFPKVEASDKESSVEATSSKNIKLFGKTLSFPDTEEPARTKSPNTSELGSVMQLANSAVIPWWAFYGGVPFAFIPLNIVHHTKVESQYNEMEKEGSISSSDKDLNLVSQSIFSSNLKRSSSENSRGFVPYRKRSLSHTETHSSSVICEENETPRIPLCL